MLTRNGGVLSAAEAAAHAAGRRIDVYVEGDVPSDVLDDLLATGIVREIVPCGHPADLALVWFTGQPMHTTGFLCPNGVVLYDPKGIRPIDAARAARQAWVDVQPWVLPLDGEQAFSQGMILTSGAYRDDVPRLSASMPVNMEEHDVERVLASFLPVVQEWVVGVDEKSTDRTLEIVSRYAEVVFRFRIEPWSFAEARNQGIHRCAFPWIFETEGHEHLDLDSLGALRVLGNLRLPQGVLMVLRDTGGGDPNAGECFFFPWVFRNHPTLRFSDQGGVHNALEMDAFGAAVGAKEPIAVRIPGTLRTVHKPHPVNRKIRDAQREDMNRKALDGYVDQGGQRKSRALFYSSQEHASAGDIRTAIRRTIEYLRTKDRFGEQMYEAHLRLGEYLLTLKKPRLAIPIFKRALPLDTNRVEAEIALGDALQLVGDVEGARQVYAKAAGVPMPVYANLFLRKSYYRGSPWRGLAATCFALGDHDGALQAAKNALLFDATDEVARKIVVHLAPESVRMA